MENGVAVLRRANAQKTALIILADIAGADRYPINKAGAGSPIYHHLEVIAVLALKFTAVVAYYCRPAQPLAEIKQLGFPLIPGRALVHLENQAVLQAVPILGPENQINHVTPFEGHVRFEHKRSIHTGGADGSRVIVAPPLH